MRIPHGHSIGGGAVLAVAEHLQPRTQPDCQPQARNRDSDGEQLIFRSLRTEIENLSPDLR